jgi:integrase
MDPSVGSATPPATAFAWWERPDGPGARPDSTPTGRRHVSGELVFTLPLRSQAAEAAVRRRFAPHQLRHAHAIELAHEGVPRKVIKRQLGHTNHVISRS